MGYSSTDLLRDSKNEYGIDMICPMRPDNSWQARTEGAISFSVFALGMRRSRYRGIKKTHLHHVWVASAINLKRVSDWFFGRKPSQTKISHFAALAA